MKSQKFWLSLVVGVVLVGGALGLVIWNQSKPPATNTTTPPVSTTTPGGETQYSMTEVAKHTGADSCWTVISGNVYDLTKYIDIHPGGSRAILGICGADGTGSFNSMPTTVLPAARAALALYKIGTLGE